MEKVTKAQVINNLTNDWTEYIKGIETLSDDMKRPYLKRQGFTTDIALISHIIAWWDDAYKNIEQMKKDLQYKSPDQDADTFNAEVVKRSAHKSITEVLPEFEEARKRLLRLVESLDEGNIENNEIQKELFWNITNHYKGHKIE